MSQANLPKLFKGIALFTPGGDLIYCIDPNKQIHWHLHLCVGLQEILDLPEPPHFLVPCYTATVDLWLDPRTQQIKRFAEAYPLVLKYQALLNAVFAMEDLAWQAAPRQEGLCDPVVIAAYRSTFGQLWEDHDLVVRFERSPTLRLQPSLTTDDEQQSLISSPQPPPETLGYVLRLFVAGNNATTERILQTLYQLLEPALHYPYTLKVIDVAKHPEQAEIDQVSATPTLVRAWPQPTRRLVGDLNNLEKILQLLGTPETRGNYEL